MPSTRISLFGVLTLAALLAGCVGSDAGAGLFTGPASARDAPADPGWPGLEEAVVRPGVRIVAVTVDLLVASREMDDCTSSFLFASPDNASLYLGTAAHCMHATGLGDPMTIAQGAATGVLVYDSYATMETRGEPVNPLNDFALVRVDDAYRHLVHPAVRHYGGPTGLAASGDAALGDRVLTYGNSEARLDVEALKPRDGYVTDATAWGTFLRFLTPGVPGDSGSGVMTADGRALGTLHAIGLTPPHTAANAAGNLDAAIAYALEHGDVAFELVTWPLMESGVLPEVPVS